ncbi:hypothetical protein DPMN_065373 [Dreissena polymorpha]|uniref:Uncharacterized protein n=1 Tax=Dreissena polymorpha TaxID=45954 RepID=A0A9D4CFP0_DREPO|nr:hypothetical protein DPMN_065373 [Dreissena polymorpha]
MVALISTALTIRGSNGIISPGDADVDIVRATVERSRHSTTALIGEDKDLLILILHYSKRYHKTIYFRSDIIKQSKENKVHNINLLKNFLETTLSCALFMLTQAVIQLQGFSALVKSQPFVN